MSAARYASGQKTVAGGGDDAGPVGSCACSVLVGSDLAVRRLNRDFRPLGFLAVVSPLLLALVVVVVVVVASQVARGWPRRPWTNTILLTVSSSPAMCAQTRPYFRPTWPLFCSLPVSLVKLCRCTVAIHAVGPEARYVAETTAALRSIRGAESSKSKNLQRRGHRGGSIAEAMVLAAAASDLSRSLSLALAFAHSGCRCSAAQSRAWERCWALAQTPRCQLAPPLQASSSWERPGSSISHLVLVHS
jgi:hypothetical protein